ncbi:hypothetical protein QTP86_002428 [Hemibagrus guttatus]|nr:hypothetical protein QTP86_002428 [Hemibagrus guttatus]
MAQLYTLLYIVRYIPLILTLVTGNFADKIGPKDEDANIARIETDTVTLKCLYESSSEYIWLYWYKQYPYSTPQFLLYKGASVGMCQILLENEISIFKKLVSRRKHEVLQNLLSSEKRTLDHWATVQFFFSLAQQRLLTIALNQIKPMYFQWKAATSHCPAHILDQFTVSTGIDKNLDQDLSFYC